MLAYTDAPFTPPCSRSIQNCFLRIWVLFAASCHRGPVLKVAARPKYSLVSRWSPRGCWGGTAVSHSLVHLLHSSWLRRQKCLGFGRAACCQTSSLSYWREVLRAERGVLSRACVQAGVALQEWWSPGKWALLSLRSSCRPGALNVNSLSWFLDSCDVLLTSWD